VRTPIRSAPNFHFPRLIEGKPAIDPDTEKVIFHLRATAKREMPNRQNAIAIRVIFVQKRCARRTYLTFEPILSFV